MGMDVCLRYEDAIVETGPFAKLYCWHYSATGQLLSMVSNFLLRTLGVRNWFPLDKKPYKYSKNPFKLKDFVTNKKNTLTDVFRLILNKKILKFIQSTYIET